MKTQKQLAQEGPAFLPKLNGYTVDVRLQQFRNVNKDNGIEFVDFDSEKGKRILAECDTSELKELMDRFTNPLGFEVCELCGKYFAGDVCNECEDNNTNE
jgi:deoxycytidine triphosphate deaminase